VVRQKMVQGAKRLIGKREKKNLLCSYADSLKGRKKPLPKTGASANSNCKERGERCSKIKERKGLSCPRSKKGDTVEKHTECSQERKKKKKKKKPICSLPRPWLRQRNRWSERAEKGNPAGVSSLKITGKPEKSKKKRCNATGEAQYRRIEETKAGGRGEEKEHQKMKDEKRWFGVQRRGKNKGGGKISLKDQRQSEIFRKSQGLEDQGVKKPRPAPERKCSSNLKKGSTVRNGQGRRFFQGRGGTLEKKCAPRTFPRKNSTTTQCEKGDKRGEETVSTVFKGA